jgi:polyhydroxyalkanoate synthesis regulator phasin
MLKLFYNKNIADNLLSRNKTNELVLYYYLKTLVTNGKIYNYKISTFHAKLRAIKGINHTFGTSKLKKLIDSLIKEGLITAHENYIQLESIHANKPYYRSKVEYKKNISFNQVKELLLLEIYKHTYYEQEKVIRLRELNQKEKHKASKVKRKAFDKLGEQFRNTDNLIFITYKSIAKNFSISISQAYILSKALIKSGLLKLETILINHKMKLSDRLENILPYLNFKGYCFERNGFLFEILGSKLRFD